MYGMIKKSQLLNNTMTLIGQGQVTVDPDTAVIRLGVQTTGSDLSTIQAQNAQISQAILAALEGTAITDLKTFQYTIDKNYTYENGNQIDRGYTVRNIFEIKTNSMNLIGTIIDTAVNAGANVVDLISFEVSNSEIYYQQALNLAVMNAIEKAKSIARSLGIAIDLIPVSIVENSTSIRPPQPFQRDLAATPIIPGNLVIEANITAEFAY